VLKKKICPNTVSAYLVQKCVGILWHKERIPTLHKRCNPVKCDNNPLGEEILSVAS